MATQASQDYVQDMFIAYLGRAAAQGALDYYGNLIDADQELGKAQLFDDLYNSAEGQAIYGSLTTEQVIEQIFQNGFNRDPAFEGLSYYYNAIGDGTFNILEAAAVIANDAAPADAAILAAKNVAADKVTAELGSDTAAIANYTGNASEARESLNKVTDSASAASYDAAAEVAAIATGNQVGSALALTTAATDVILGTSDNDTITGSSTTYQTGDLVLDTTTSDSDVLTVTTTGDMAGVPTVSGVETINFTVQDFTATNNVYDVALTNVSGSGTTVNLDVDYGGSTIVSANVTGAPSGATIVGSSDFTTAMTVAAAGDNETLTVSSPAATTTVSSAGTLVKATVTSSSATAATIDVDADGTADVTTTAAAMLLDAVAATTVVANSAGAFTAQTGTGGENLTAATSIDITAGGAIIIDTNAATTATLAGVGTATDSSVVDNGNVLTSLSVSGNGGAVDYDVAGATKLTSVTVTGDQAVNIITDASVVDGASTTNTFTVTDNSTAASTLTLGTAAGDVDISASTVDTVVLSVDNNTKTMTVADGQAITITTDQTATTVDGAGTAPGTQTATITLNDGVAGANSADLTSITFTDLATATINAASETQAPTIGAIVGSADNTKVTIEAGAVGAVLNGTSNLGTGTLTINSSGAVNMTGAAITAASVTTSGAGAVTWTTISGATLASVSTDSGADSLTVSVTGDINVDSNGGNDNIIVGAITTLAADDVVLDGGEGTSDTITITDAANLGTYATMSWSNFENFAFTDVGANGAAITLNSNQLDGQSYIVSGPAAGQTDVLTLAVSTTTSTVDLSNLVINNSVFGADAGDSFVVDANANTIAMALTGSNIKDVLTGGTKDDSIVGGAGDDTLVGGAGADTMSSVSGANGFTGGDGADDMTGGTGVDTFNYDNVDDTAAGEVVNGGGGTDILNFASGADTTVDLTGMTVSLVETLTIADAADTITMQQGTGIVTVNGLATGTASSLTLVKGATDFEAAAEASAAAVDIAGEWFLDLSDNTDATLTYYDETLGKAVTITVAGVDDGGGTDDGEAVSIVAGNLVLTVD